MDDVHDRLVDEVRTHSPTRRANGSFAIVWDLSPVAAASGSGISPKSRRHRWQPFRRVYAAASPRTLVLWDIDHPLIETRAVGRAICRRAFLAATGIPLAEFAPVSGRTEFDIMHDP